VESRGRGAYRSRSERVVPEVCICSVCCRRSAKPRSDPRVAKVRNAIHRCKPVVCRRDRTARARTCGSLVRGPSRQQGRSGCPTGPAREGPTTAAPGRSPSTPRAQAHLVDPQHPQAQQAARPRERDDARRARPAAAADVHLKPRERRIASEAPKRLACEDAGRQVELPQARPRHGSCPVYRVTIRGDALEYRGEQYVEARSASASSSPRSTPSSLASPGAALRPGSTAETASTATWVPRSVSSVAAGRSSTAATGYA